MIGDGIANNLGRRAEILLVEDNPGDARLAKEAMKDSKVYNAIHVAEDGVEAISFLRKEGKYADVPRPDLILLDLNLPRMDGRETLSIIKSDPDLRRIPVVILTTSNDDTDILNAYDLHANCYIQKPVDLDQFIQIVESIENFWLRTVRLPNNSEADWK
jgi:chemotaxis family two-component system response regulator Rcp1